MYDFSCEHLCGRVESEAFRHKGAFIILCGARYFDAWTFDNAGRLKTETIDHFDDALDRTESFTMDLVGNRLGRTVDLALTPGVVDQVFASNYDANDRLLVETLDQDNNGTIDQTTTYDWGITGADADGVTQQLGKTVRNSASVLISRQLLSYNLQGQLAAVVNETFDGTGTLSGRTQVAYQYDPAGLRSLAVEAADADLDGAFTGAETVRSTEYLFDPHSLTGLPQVLTEMEKNPAGQPVKRVSYTFGLDEITQTVTQFDPSTGSIISSATHTFAHDGHGSVRALVDAASALAQVYTYTAYGELLAIHNAAGSFLSSSAADALTSLLYSGEAFDARTGWQFLRARWYRPDIGRFGQVDPTGGDRLFPLSFHKYAYTSGDPINFGDPTGMFEGLVGLLASFSISTGQRGTSAGTSATVLNYARNALRIYEFLSWAIDLVLSVSNEGAFGAIKALGVDPSEIKEITEKLTNYRLMDLSVASLKQMAGVDPNFGFNLPQGNGRSGRIAKAFRLVRRALGAIKVGNEKIGEIGTAFLGWLLGFENPRLTRPANRRHGPDFVLQHKKFPALFAIAEAKGGTSRLGKSGLRARPWPSGMVAQLPGGPFPQMGTRWLNFWLRKYIDVNSTSSAGRALRNSFFDVPPTPMLALVVSVDFSRKSPHHEFEVAFQVFLPPIGAVGFQAWPSEFVGHNLDEP